MKREDNLESVEELRSFSGADSGRCETARTVLQESDYYDPSFNDPEDCE